MPIIGLTDKQSIKPRLPRLGKLRKGGEKPESGKQPGADLDYFRFTSDNPEIVAAFQEAYGEKPAAIPVYLPYPTPEENFETWKEAWKAGGMQHRCDGKTMQVWLGDDGKYHREPKPCAGGCDEIGRLELILPQLWLAGHVGYVTLETHSINDLISISEALEDTYLKRLDAGADLIGLEFILRRVPEKISTPAGSNGGRARREKWLVKLEPSASWVRLQLEAKKGDAAMMLGSGEIVESQDPVEQVIDHAPVTSGLANEPTPAQQPPKNGNGRPTNNQQVVKQQAEMKVFEAAKVTTARGTPLESLNRDQLGRIVESYEVQMADGKSLSEQQARILKAAKTLLTRASAEHIAAYDKLCEEAEALHIACPITHPGITLGELRSLFQEVQDEIKEYKIARMNGQTEEG
jgi:hypothetical protein